MLGGIDLDRILSIAPPACSVTVLFISLLFLVLSPFLAAIVWAGAIGITIYPLYEKWSLPTRTPHEACG
jgi:predicted PurR-regulated permease PerM